MAVFVLDRGHRPLMPCSEKRARILLHRKRAVIHRIVPFTIRHIERSATSSQVQSMVLKLDPGSRTTGMALVRIERRENGALHHAVHLAIVEHRGEQVHHNMRQRSAFRRRRRSSTLRYRSPRFQHRTRPKGWLPPSLRSRVGNILSWARRYNYLAPLERLDVERVKFDLTLMQNPEIAGVMYQRGDLVAWEIRAYLLEKFQRCFVYCGKSNVPFEIDHVQPRSRGGSDRVSNLVLVCHECNASKANQTASEYGHPAVEAQAKVPLRDAAAVNATSYLLCDSLRSLGLPLTAWSGGRARWNRRRFSIPKLHTLDALCVGEICGIDVGKGLTLQIVATGRGSYQRTNVDASGFPRGYLLSHKRALGFQTGDLVRAEVPAHFKSGGVRVGRLAVRSSGTFRMGKFDGINARYCRIIQRPDGYSYSTVSTEWSGSSSLAAMPSIYEPC